MTTETTTFALTIAGSAADPDWLDAFTAGEPTDEVDLGKTRDEFIRLAEDRIRAHYPDAAITWERGNGIHTRIIADTGGDWYNSDTYQREDAIIETVRNILSDLFDESDRWLCWR